MTHHCNSAPWVSSTAAGVGWGRGEVEVYVYFFHVVVLGFRIRRHHSLFIGSQYRKINSLLYPSIMGLCNGGAYRWRIEVLDELQDYISELSSASHSL